jgi:structural maintenance of chromosome 1
VNVQKIASYIQRRASAVGGKSGPPLQFLVISLKDAFFSHADALIGIYKDSASDCSRALTLDLSKYAHVENTEEEEEEEVEEEEMKAEGRAA